MSWQAAIVWDRLIISSQWHLRGPNRNRLTICTSISIPSSPRRPGRTSVKLGPALRMLKCHLEGFTMNSNSSRVTHVDRSCLNRALDLQPNTRAALRLAGFTWSWNSGQPVRAIRWARGLHLHYPDLSRLPGKSRLRVSCQRLRTSRGSRPGRPFATRNQNDRIQGNASGAASGAGDSETLQHVG